MHFFGLTQIQPVCKGNTFAFISFPKNQEIGVKAIEKFKAEIVNSILENGFFLEGSTSKIGPFGLGKRPFTRPSFLTEKKNLIYTSLIIDER